MDYSQVSQLYIIQKNLKTINTAIAIAAAKCHRSLESITLVAVSKGQPIKKIKAAIDCGQIHFGENYLQEALPKIKALAKHNLIWHYLGKLQRRKAKLIAQNFAWIETVASYATAELLNNHCPAHLPYLNICIQVNISKEPNKNGVCSEEALDLAKKVRQLPNLRLRGLMAIPHYYNKLELQLKSFNEIFSLAKTLHQHNITIDTLSMGMSSDFPAAIIAGATIVRIGTGIFGSRTKNI